MVDLQGDVFGIIALGYVGIGHDGVLRLAEGNVRDGVHQRVADAAALLRNGSVGVKADRIAVEEFPELRGHVEGDKAQLHAGLLIVEAREVHKFVLKVVDNVVMLVIMLGKDDHAVTLAQLLDGFAEGGNEPCVVVDGDSVGAVEDQHREGRDEMAQELIKPADALRLL